MDPLSIATGLAAFRGRGPGSDAERRAALWLARSLQRPGRDVEVRTLWVRPQWPAALALHAALGIVGSIVTVSSPAIGAGVLAATLVSFGLDLSGRAFLLRSLLPRRATQNVLARPRAREKAKRVRLIVTAHYDAPRSGLAYRDGVRRAVARASRGHAPGPLTVVLGALALLTALAALQLGGAGGQILRALQLAATVALLLALALLVDIALSHTGPGANDNASAVGVALALTAALDRAPPPHLAVDVVLAGAGEGSALGLRAQLREWRRHLPREGAVVLDLLPCGRGRPRFWTRDGVGLPLRLHPRLVALAQAVARDEAHLEASAYRGRGSSGAYAARAAGFPALAIGCLDGDGVALGGRQHTDTVEALDPDALRAALEFCLVLVDRIDSEIASGRVA
jgi:hypothetical protein